MKAKVHLLTGLTAYDIVGVAYEFDGGLWLSTFHGGLRRQFGGVTRVGKRKKILSVLYTEFYQTNVYPPWPETLPAPLSSRCQILLAAAGKISCQPMVDVGSLISLIYPAGFVLSTPDVQLMT